MIRIAVLVFLSLFIASCEEKPDPRESYSYNAFFEYGGKRIYVGTVTGLSSCKYIVSSFYSKRRKYVKSSWDYICCLRTADNNCVEKHKYEND